MVEQALLAAEQLKDESFSLELFSHCDLVKPEDRDVYNDLVTQRVHLHAVEASQDSPSTMVKEWQVWLRRFRTVVVQNRQLARMIAPVAMHMQDMIKALQGNKSTFVEYSIGPESSTVFIVDSDGRISSEILPVKRANLQYQISAILNSSRNSSGSTNVYRDRQILSNLYNQLLPPPVRALIPNNPDRTLVIIPDGVLFNLPFAALIGEDGKFLIENHTLTMACSMGAFIDTPSQYSNDNSIVVAADGLGAGDNVISSGVFQPELITKLSGEQDSVSDLCNELKGKSIIHVSSRLLLEPNNPFASFVSIGEKNGLEKKVMADTLFGTNLNSDLAVWSASSVNAKDEKSVKVFSRGLNYAGVRNVLMSLWLAPEPERTNELIEFYKNRQIGLTQAQSLRKAELIALSKDPSPHSWAAFQLLDLD